MRRGFGHRAVMRIKEMADPRVAADQDEPSRLRIAAPGLQKPEQPLDCDIHRTFGRFLAGGEMDDMAAALHRRSRNGRSESEPRSVSCPGRAGISR